MMAVTLKAAKYSRPKPSAKQAPLIKQILYLIAGIRIMKIIIFATALMTIVSASHYGEEDHGGTTYHETSKPVEVPIYKKYAIPIPHPVPVAVPQHIKIPIPHPYEVQVSIPHPVPVEVVKHVEIPVEKPEPYIVEKKVPFVVEKPYPVTVEKHFPVPIPKPYPVHVPVYKHIFHHQSKGHGGGWKH